jgi:hypothetical protein
MHRRSAGIHGYRMFRRHGLGKIMFESFDSRTGSHPTGTKARRDFRNLVFRDGRSEKWNISTLQLVRFHHRMPNNEEVIAGKAKSRIASPIHGKHQADSLFTTKDKVLPYFL